MDEIVTVVDKNNKVIGKKLRKDLTDDECWRASCIWIEDGKGNVLLQKRQSDRKVDPDKWTCAVVGTVAADDSYEITAIREAAEEIGVKDIILKPAGLVYIKASFGWRWYQGFTAEYDWPLESFTPQEEEVAELAWVDKETVLQEIRNKDPKYTPGVHCYFDLFNLEA